MAMTMEEAPTKGRRETKMTTMMENDNTTSSSSRQPAKKEWQE